MNGNEHSVREIVPYFKVVATFYIRPLKGNYFICINVLKPDWIDEDRDYLSFYAMERDYNHTLAWPFVGMFTVSLLNSLDDKSHYTKSDRHRGRQCGHQ